MLSIGAPQPLVLSRIRNPTRHQTFVRGLDQYVDDTWPGGLEGFGEWVGRQEPTIIALSRQVPEWLRPTIKKDYLNAGRGPSWTWYLHRSAVSDLRNGGTP